MQKGANKNTNADDISEIKSANKQRKIYIVKTSSIILNY